MFLTANENEDNGKGKKSDGVPQPYFPDYRETGTVPPAALDEGAGLDFGMKSWQENFPNLN